MKRIGWRAEREARDLTRATIKEVGSAAGKGAAFGIGHEYGPDLIEFIKNLLGQ